MRQTFELKVGTLLFQKTVSARRSCRQQGFVLFTADTFSRMTHFLLCNSKSVISCRCGLGRQQVPVQLEAVRAHLTLRLLAFETPSRPVESCFHRQRHWRRGPAGQIMAHFPAAHVLRAGKHTQPY